MNSKNHEWNGCERDLDLDLLSTLQYRTWLFWTFDSDTRFFMLKSMLFWTTIGAILLYGP